MKKTWGATLTTLQDMTVLDDYDVSQSFTHSPSSESVKSSVSDGYLNKPSLAKRRANQQETELFYFTVREQRGLTFRFKDTRYTVNSTSVFFVLILRNSASILRAVISFPNCRPNMTY